LKRRDCKLSGKIKKWHQLSKKKPKLPSIVEEMLLVENREWEDEILNL
jgi:hypothetical protein